jgi:predicted ATPase with chaperone activity
MQFYPPRPVTLEDTGVSRPFLTDLILRTLYAANELIGIAIAERVALPFPGIVSEILEALRHDAAIEIKAQRGLGDAGYLYAITEKGASRARDSMDKLTYTGPAPVPFEDYVKSALAQTVRNVVVTQENIRRAFQDLIINDSVLDEVGPAVNSGSSMFLFGYPGNGKTSIAERIMKLMGDHLFMPYAVEVDGSVIKVFDAINHSPVEEKGPDGLPKRPDWDARWVKIERPVVMVGGELTMSSLDLLYNDNGKYYEAPLQMKANGGMFLIDDFGRQMIRPQDLLNRWIVPLEKRVDFLTLNTGKKISIPFEQLIVFSTNLDPKDLVDDAFLRRIKFKINVLDPDENQFRAIFQLMCNRRGVQFEESMFKYLLDRFYRPVGRPLRMCQPRDIIDQIISIAKYKMVPAEMNRLLIDRACETYFVSL